MSREWGASSGPAPLQGRPYSAAERGETPVGAVVVGRDGVVLAADGNRVRERADPTAHAEIVAIREVLDRDSLSRLVRLANSEENFVSNFAGEAHRVHWDLLRRTGFDPLNKLGGLLDGPYGTRQVGDQTWYIWPDFAALDADDLLPEKLSFTDRARLKELVGEAGLERIRAGQGYPGVRTAIAQDGDWLYFVHETQQDTEESE